VGLVIGGADGNETTEVQVTSASSLGVGALYQQRSWCGFDLGVLVRCNQADATPQRVAKVADALPTSSPVPLQGRTPTPAAGEPESGARDGLEDESGGGSQDAGVPSRTSIAGLICAYPWPQGCDYWIGIAWCESTLGEDPNAYTYWNPYVGLFQVWIGHGYSRKWLKDDINNVLAAWELSREGTRTSPWPACQWQ